ncbi:YdcF family protein, partial [Mesorhizobium sp. M7A.T.Ca.US.000.02.1.1]
LILENKSRNTYENAVFTKELVTPKPGETWLLVTSAFHMPRAKALFDKAGFATVPWPVDYRTSGKEGIGLFRDNPADSLQATTMAIREWIGLFAYWLSGRINQPFPGG